MFTSGCFQTTVILPHRNGAFVKAKINPAAFRQLYAFQSILFNPQMIPFWKPLKKRSQYLLFGNQELSWPLKESFVYSRPEWFMAREAGGKVHLKTRILKVKSTYLMKCLEANNQIKVISKKSNYPITICIFFFLSLSFSIWCKNFCNGIKVKISAHLAQLSQWAILFKS